MSDAAKPLPTGQHEFQIAKAEIVKTIPASGDKKAATVLKLGLIGSAGEKGWAEFFAPDGTTPPSEGTKETLILTDDPKWGMKAARPRTGGGGFRGAPKDSNSIEAQCAFKGAIDLIVADKATLMELADLTRKCADAIRGAK